MYITLNKVMIVIHFYMYEVILLVSLMNLPEIKMLITNNTINVINFNLRTRKNIIKVNQRFFGRKFLNVLYLML